MFKELFDALGTAFAMGWEILWPLVLGFALSAKKRYPFLINCDTKDLRAISRCKRIHDDLVKDSNSGYPRSKASRTSK